MGAFLTVRKVTPQHRESGLSKSNRHGHQHWSLAVRPSTVCEHHPNAARCAGMMEESAHSRHGLLCERLNVWAQAFGNSIHDVLDSKLWILDSVTVSVSQSFGRSVPSAPKLGDC